MILEKTETKLPGYFVTHVPGPHPSPKHPELELDDTAMPRKRILNGEAKPQSLSKAKDNCVLVLDGDSGPEEEWPVYAAD